MTPPRKPRGESRPERTPRNAGPGAGPEHGGEPPPPQTPQQEAQLKLILDAYGDEIDKGPADWERVGIQYLYRKNHLLIRDEYLDRVRSILDVGRLTSRVEAPLVRGVTLVSIPGDPEDALRLVRGPVGGIGEARARPDVDQLGPGVAAPDYLVSITPPSGATGGCPSSEPVPVGEASAPDPYLRTDRAAGEGIRVVVIDTGLDPDAPGSHPWMKGVTGDPDPAVQAGYGVTRALGPYAGHGTFIAGVVRAVAPRAEVIVKAVMNKTGAVFESDLVRALDSVLDEDFPDVISMSAGTWTFDPTGLLGLSVFNETRLRHHKGVVLVVAAGNDNSRRSFWPAAAPWTVSVGALAEDWSTRADFSNFGRWVDVFAPGEDLVSAFPVGTYTYQEPSLPHHVPPHQPGDTAEFKGMARWSGTSFSTPVVAGMIAARMSSTGENGRDAAAALLAIARSAAISGVGAVLLPR